MAFIHVTIIVNLELDSVLLKGVYFGEYRERIAQSSPRSTAADFAGGAREALAPKSALLIHFTLRQTFSNFCRCKIIHCAFSVTEESFQ